MSRGERENLVVILIITNFIDNFK